MMDPQKKAYIIATLRRASYRWKPRTEVMKKARVSRGMYKCAECLEIVGRKQIQMDHIQAAVDPVVGWVSVDEFADRLLVDESGWQALCKPCHKTKSSAEAAIRKATRAANKPVKVKKPRKKKNESSKV